MSVKDMENGEKTKQVVELFEVNEQRRRVMLEDDYKITRLDYKITKSFFLEDDPNHIKIQKKIGKF